VFQTTSNIFPVGLKFKSAFGEYQYFNEICLIRPRKPAQGSTTQVKQSKAVPLQSWSGPEGSRKLKFPDFMTAAQDGGKVVSLTHRPPLPTGNTPWYSFLLEAESTPGP